MIPVVIPSSGGDCFAVYQAAPGPAVLICPPFGDEALKTARIWRDLAMDLAKYGLATLRFDLPGTGNSAGEPTDPERIDAWRGAVRACAAWLADRHDGRVILFGHRFGALLALDAAASSVEAERLVLLDPPTSGAAQARYLRGRARMAGLGPPPEGPDSIQVGGVPLSPAILLALSDLPPPLAGPSFPPALLVLNDSASSRSPWPDRLRAAGSTVETMPFHGFEDFVPSDPFRAKAPVAVLERVIQYLVRTAGPLGPTTAIVPLPRAELGFDGFTDVPIQFGPGNGMFGMLCRPDNHATDLPALLLPTTGIDPCSGLSRMWTELARRVARQGITSLRFDMSGVGESQGRLTTDLLAAAYHPDRTADVRSAVDALAAQGFSQVSVVAYCSGAYAAWHAAVQDLRIGAILTGNLVYMNLQTMLTEDVLRLRPGSSRLGVRSGSAARRLTAPGLSALRQLDDFTRRVIPRPIRHLLRRWEADQKETRRHVKALTARGCSISMVMAQDDHGHVRLRRAFGETLRLPEGAELIVIPDADHLFSHRRHRARFLDLAAAFALRRPNPGVATTSTSISVLETAS